ncbi:metacaspase-1 [Rhodotorula diobovata]|uniref:Metacaspase-1 n=1 Tax=Rhodotorula diobovata TaxID=5288 RepID=A0A5C5FSD2_9BASI|nr:metacaspase-1 [Rhodotorula diobovata]
MAYPGQKYHMGYKHTVIPEGQGQPQFGGPPPQQYGQPQYGQPQFGGGYGGPPPPPGPPPQFGGGYGAPPPGPPPGQYGGGYGGGGGGGSGGGYGGGRDNGSSGYNHPHASQQQYNAPPAFSGQSPYPQQYGTAPGPPPTHYGAQPQRYNGPPQYQGGQFEMHMQPPSNMSGYYSQLTGKRKALLIGINYEGTSSALKGCHNDVRNVSKFLVERYGYKEEDMVLLLDERGAAPMSIPTRENMIRAMQWLVRDARPNDSLFFHYSGHGGQTRGNEGDEVDGMDETLYPLDHKTAGHIVDNDLHRIMVGPLPQGCRLTAIFDCCHSGSALDLPYMYSTKGKLKEPNMLADAGSGALGAATSYLRGDIGGVFKTLTSVGKRLANGDKATEYTKQTRSSNADVISLSGCKDTQTSADTSMAGKATGAMSWALIASLTKYPQQTWLQLLNTIRDEIKTYSQKPQLACSHEMDLNLIAAF